MNIRLKLTLQFTMIIALVLIVFSVALYYFSASYRENDYYQRLESRARTTARLLIDTEEIDERLLEIIDRGTLSLNQENIIVYDDSFQVIYKSGYDFSFPLHEYMEKDLTDYEIYTTRNGQREAVILRHVLSEKNFYVVVSAWDKYGFLKLTNLLNILLIGLGFSIFLSFFFGYLLSLRALYPINRIVSQVNNITASSLGERIDEGKNRDELNLLASTFNQMLQRLETAFEMQKNFVNNASHEFRTPLTLILGEIELALQKDADPNEYQQILKDVFQDIKSLNKLSNDLLDLAYVSLDESNILLDEVRLDEILIQASGEMKKRSKEFNIDLSFGNMPENPDYLTIQGNEFFMKTVFSNLISNACKYSENKSVKIHFTANEETISIAFADEGIGIPADEIDKVFQPFYRAWNQKSRQGHGIGLALVDKIIKLHRGNIIVNSVLNSGTTFRIEFYKT